MSAFDFHLLSLRLQLTLNQILSALTDLVNRSCPRKDVHSMALLAEDVRPGCVLELGAMRTLRHDLANV